MKLAGQPDDKIASDLLPAYREGRQARIARYEAAAKAIIGKE